VIAELDGAAAVITAGGSGIGRATARALAAAGTRVAVSDINLERAVAVADEITAVGGEALAVACDVSSDDDMRKLRDAAVTQFGRVDIVMNNAGIIMLGAPQDIPVEAWRRALDVNVLSVARSIRMFLPGLLAQGRGHVVNTASTSGLWAYGDDRLPYAASKAAVIALSESLALYAVPRGVGVTCLCPGPVRTNIAEQVRVFGTPGPIQPPPLALIDAADVGAQVVAAIRNGTFFLPTHDEVRGIVRERGADPEGFLAALIKERHPA
jgi:NAD(P)-dependent dehydrogenase (short-subunit alcohol dehydrogenase family)